MLWATLILGCGPTLTRTAGVTRLPPVVTTSPTSEHAGVLAESLDQRHHTPITIHQAINLSNRQLLLYGWESLRAWIAFQRLEPWEREDAEWSADGELALWLNGLAQRSNAEALRQRLDALRESCDPDESNDQCTEADLWERALAEVPTASCGLDRLAFATFTAVPGSRSSTLVATRILDGRRCGSTSNRISAFQLDDDDRLEIVVEVHWTGEETSFAELLLLDDDLEVLIVRRLYTRPNSAESDLEPVADARFWFSDTTGDSAVDLVIERYEVPSSCIEQGCSSLVVSGDGQERRCAPSPQPSCERQAIDREILQRDPIFGIWL